MKKFSLILFVSVLNLTVSRADEGMWLPILLKSTAESDMQKLGCKLSAEDIYSVNKSSLKDAVVLFGGGCTGEMISAEGLLITNHHCGYGQIQSHSTVENDYLTNGFWAMEKKAELKCPGLTVTFIVRMEDVTARMLENLPSGLTEKQRDSVLQARGKAIEQESVKGTHYNARVRSFYYGNEFYLFVMETFKDVRLVGAPPESIGKFGGDTDNWIWPRHTGDFSLFRVYAGKDNKPADYSPDNVPFVPRHFLPVSLKGVKEEDFTMVFGFPGRTQEYLPAVAVDMIKNTSNPIKVKARETRLAIWEKDMKQSTKVRIQYSAKYAGVSNAYKKWTGEIFGLEKAGAMQVKLDRERTFASRLKQNSEWNSKYGHILPGFESAYQKILPYQKLVDYFNETVAAVEIIRYANGFKALMDAKPEELAKKLEGFRSSAKGYFKDHNPATDQKLFVAMLKMYYDNVDKASHPDIFQTVESKFKGDFAKYAEMVYSKSLFASEAKVNELLADYTPDKAKKIQKDPAYILARSAFGLYETRIQPAFNSLNDGLTRLNREYMEALRVVIPEKRYYPDANSTLRVAYGKVKGYPGKDGVLFTSVTTLDGIIEKEDSTNSEFVVPKKLKELHRTRDYGQYAAADGRLNVAFVATNHTTGGNSGSPVLDAEGNLIGVNFDRNWEGTANDIMYNSLRGRNITVDIRYVLFVIDKFAGASHLVNEMKLVR